MITPAYVQTMARYNIWQNENIYAAAARLPDGARTQDRGAFFGSIHATLNHILWADQIWLKRFGVGEGPMAKTIPEGLSQYPAWDGLVAARNACDGAITSFANAITPAALTGDLTWYSVGAARDLVTPMGIAVTHMFNHQTHHRGQVHALLTASGIKPGSTDLPFMI